MKVGKSSVRCQSKEESTGTAPDIVAVSHEELKGANRDLLLPRRVKAALFCGTVPPGLPYPAVSVVSADRLSVCRGEGLPVPSQIQMLGVDDEEYVCEREIPSLSSLAVDFRGAAQEAMREIFVHLETGARSEAPIGGAAVNGVAVSRPPTRSWPECGTGADDDVRTVVRNSVSAWARRIDSTVSVSVSPNRFRYTRPR